MNVSSVSHPYTNTNIWQFVALEGETFIYPFFHNGLSFAGSLAEGWLEPIAADTGQEVGYDHSRSHLQSLTNHSI